MMTEDQVIKTLNIHVTKRMKVNDAGVCTMIEKNNIDVEFVPKLITKPLKDKIKYEATELNFLKKSSRAKLPL